jgi:hypothetical protein
MVETLDTHYIYIFSSAGCERSSSFKERHPKFRKSATPDYIIAARGNHALKRQNSLQSDQSEVSSLMDTTANSPNNSSSDDLPLDMSIKKRPATPPPPPPYRFNPLRQHSPPGSPPASHLPILPSPVYKAPPPYPATPSPPAAALPPPPSYEDSTIKCSYPSKTSSPPVKPHDLEEKTTVKEITIITSKWTFLSKSLRNIFLSIHATYLQIGFVIEQKKFGRKRDLNKQYINKISNLYINVPVYLSHSLRIFFI